LLQHDYHKEAQEKQDDGTNKRSKLRGIKPEEIKSQCNSPTGAS